MWPFGGLTMVGLALLPSAWHWLRHTPETAWQSAGSYAVTDAIFSIGAVLFLNICLKYGQSRSQARPAPYPGAWVESDGRQQVPRGFAPGYLGFALIMSFIIPALVLLYMVLATNSSTSVSRPLACATLAPYLMVFIPQMLLETKYLNRSFMTPVLPVLYMYYRLWQFIRSLALVARYEADSVGGSAASMLKVYLVCLLVFWVFDTACTMVWMPWMYDWQLQDPQLLQKLAEQRQHAQLMLVQQKQQQKVQQASDAGLSQSEIARSSGLDSPAGTSSPGRRMTTRSMAKTPTSSAATARKPAAAAGEAVSPRSRRRVAASGTNNVETYGFGA